MTQEPDLFQSAAPKRKQPLAARMRPRKLTEILGQPHLTSTGALLPRLLAKNEFGSIILYGPPGCGKTSLAEVVANETKSRFVKLNAVASGTKEVRAEIEKARMHPEQITILFIDELHRFNKTQQDLLLPDVEDGTIRLIGATTHNPAFYVNSPILSRSHLFRLNAIDGQIVAQALEGALNDTERGLGNYGITSDPEVLKDIAKLAGGDMRHALNALEALVISLPDNEKALTKDHLKAFAEERKLRYDHDEDGHYDTISAFIKSIRGSDPDATLFWLIKMIEAGEDPRFIARRMIVHASEDVGFADNRGLQLATAAAAAVDYVGLPEAQFALAHAAIYLACAEKSCSITNALAKAHAALKEHPHMEVPSAIRDNHYSKPAYLESPKDDDYSYSHNFEGNVSGQDYLSIPLKLYEPAKAGEELILSQLVDWRNGLKKKKNAANKPQL